MVPREIQQNPPKLLGNHRIAKTKAVMKKILKLLLPPHFLPTPPSNVVYDEDMIEVVENDVIIIISTTLLEGGRGWNKDNFGLFPNSPLWSNHKSQYILWRTVDTLTWGAIYSFPLTLGGDSIQEPGTWWKIEPFLCIKISIEIIFTLEKKKSTAEHFNKIEQNKLTIKV